MIRTHGRGVIKGQVHGRVLQFVQKIYFSRRVDVFEQIWGQGLIVNRVPRVQLDGPAILGQVLPENNIVIKATDAAEDMDIKISAWQIVEQTDHQGEAEFWP